MGNTQQIHAALAAVLSEVDAITKDRVNEVQRFRFRGVDDVYNALHPLFAKHKLYVRPEVIEVRQTERQTAKGAVQLHAVVKMRYHLTASDGSSIPMEVEGEAADSGDKSIGKAMQYAYKIGLLQMFLIPTEEESDPDAQATEWAKRQQQPARGAPPAARAATVAVAPPADPAAGALDAIRKATTPEQVGRYREEARKRPDLAGSMQRIEAVAVERTQQLLRAEQGDGR